MPQTKRHRESAFSIKNGDPRRTRTFDPMVKSHLLYRLSYRTTFFSKQVALLPTELKILHTEIKVGKLDVKIFLQKSNF